MTLIVLGEHSAHPGLIFGVSDFLITSKLFPRHQQRRHNIRYRIERADTCFPVRSERKILISEDESVILFWSGSRVVANFVFRWFRDKFVDMVPNPAECFVKHAGLSSQELDQISFYVFLFRDGKRASQLFNGANSVNKHFTLYGLGVDFFEFFDCIDKYHIKKMNYNSGIEFFLLSLIEIASYRLSNEMIERRPSFSSSGLMFEFFAIDGRGLHSLPFLICRWFYDGKSIRRLSGSFSRSIGPRHSVIFIPPSEASCTRECVSDIRKNFGVNVMEALYSRKGIINDGLLSNNESKHDDYCDLPQIEAHFIFDSSSPNIVRNFSSANIQKNKNLSFLRYFRVSPPRVWIKPNSSLIMKTVKDQRNYKDEEVFLKSKLF